MTKNQLNETNSHYEWRKQLVGYPTPPQPTHPSTSGRVSCIAPAAARYCLISSGPSNIPIPRSSQTINLHYRFSPEPCVPICSRAIPGRRLTASRSTRTISLQHYQHPNPISGSSSQPIPGSHKPTAPLVTFHPPSIPNSNSHYTINNPPSYIFPLSEN